jgi:dynein heavy chain 2, cytosolic
LRRLDVFLENARRFNARWEKLQPGYIDLDRREETAQAVELLDEFRQELDEMSTNMQTMEKECQYFGVELPPSDLLADVEHGLPLKEACWGIYKEFVQCIDAMGAKKWRAFMAETPHDLEDLIFRFLKDSKERLSGRDDRFLSYFSEFVGSYRAMLPMMTYIRGDGWSDDHWKDLMGILGMKASISSYELTVYNFLERRGRIIQAEEKLRNLHARAQGEVRIVHMMFMFHTLVICNFYVIIIRQIC